MKRESATTTGPDQRRKTKAAATDRSRHDLPSGQAPRRLVYRFAPLVALFAVTFAAYSPVFHAGYVWDDDVYVTRNTTLTSPGGLGRIWFETGATIQYYPMVFTTFWLERHVWGLNPLGYHLTNIVLHATSAILLWIALKRLRLPGAYLAAIIFALHPVQVESVAWITERKNILAGTFAAASLLGYLRFSGIESVSPSAFRRWLAYAATLALFTCALFSKTAVCGLPVVFALLVWWKRGRLRIADLWPLLPMLVVGVALGLTTAWYEKHIVAYRGTPWHLPPLERILLAGRILCFYPAKLIWPHPLIFSYPRWEIDQGVWAQFLYPAVVAALLIILWVARTKIGKGPLVAVLAYVVMLFPALGFFNVYPMKYSYVADHFQYHACAALIVLAAVGLARAAAFILPVAGGEPVRRPALSTVMGRWALAGALLLPLGLKTRQQAALYQDADTLWGHTLSLNPQSWVAHLNLAKACQSRADREGLVRHLREAIRLRPDDANSCKVLADCLSSMGRYSEAAGYYEQALQLVPDDGQMHHNLANILADQGQHERAAMHYRECIRLIPNDALPHLSFAFMLAGRGDWHGAVVELRSALALRPDWEMAQRELAWILATASPADLRDPEEAIRLATSACQKTGNKDPFYLDALGAALAQGGRFTEASAVARQALAAMGPSSEPALAQGLKLRLSLYAQSRPYVDTSRRQ